jgi:ABC-2 type transport system permease protein
VDPARIGALAQRIFRAFRHDHRTLGLIVVVPLVVMALIGYLVGDDKQPLEVGLFAAGAEDRFARLFEEQPGVEIVAVYDTPEAAREAVLSGTIDGAVGPVFIRCVGECPPPAVQVYVPGIDVQVESPIVQAAARANALAAGQEVPLGSVPGVQIERIELPSGERPSTISFAAPAMITVFAFLFTFMLTSVAFLRERSSGTLERLLASPITKAEVLAGYLLGFMPFAAIQATVVLGYAIVVLNAHVAGSMWLVILVLTLLVIGVVNLGIALSFYARNELQVIQFIPLVLLPQVFLGGLFWPVSTLWEPLTWFSAAFPVTHAVHALRSVMLGRAGIGDIAGDLWALLAFAAAMILLGTVVLRRQRA